MTPKSILFLFVKIFLYPLATIITLLLLSTTFPYFLPTHLDPVHYIINNNNKQQYCQRLKTPETALHNFLDHYSQCVIITGGNSGVGAALAIDLGKNPNSKILITGRHETRLQEIVTKYIPPSQRLLHGKGIQQLDLGDDHSIEEFSRVIKHIIDSSDCNGRLTLFLNAGMTYNPRYEGPWTSKNEDKNDLLFEANFLSNVKLIKLIPGLRPVIRVVITASSQMYQGMENNVFTDGTNPGKMNESVGTRHLRYATSKLAVTALTFELQSRGWDVRVVTPGFVSTNIAFSNAYRANVTRIMGSYSSTLRENIEQGFPIAFSSMEGAETILHVANIDNGDDAHNRFYSPSYIPQFLPREWMKAYVVIFQKATWRHEYFYSCPGPQILHDRKWREKFNQAFLDSSE
jgi:NAD(P)-dependent dehydrogenase (short-subunit alcohol dehydrogenase family)